MCAAHQYGENIYQYTYTSTTIHEPSKDMELKKYDLSPVLCVSGDHFQSVLSGRLYTYRGSTYNTYMYHRGYILSEYASG